MSRGMPADEPGGQITGYIARWDRDAYVAARAEWKANADALEQRLAFSAMTPDGVLVVPADASEADADRIRRRFAGTDAGARTDDNTIATWVFEMRRQRDDILRATGTPPATISTHLVPDRLRAEIMRGLRGDGLVSMRDNGDGRTTFVFRAPGSPNDDPPVDETPPVPDPFADVAARLDAARRAEDAARWRSRNYGQALHDHRRAVVRSQLRRVLCAGMVAVVAVYLLALTGMPMPVAAALAGAVVGVVDRVGGRPMVTAQRFLWPDPGEWSAVCEAYEAALLELYAAEIADGMARMLAAAGWDGDEPPRQLEAGS